MVWCMELLCSKILVYTKRKFLDKTDIASLTEAAKLSQRLILVYLLPQITLSDWRLCIRSKWRRLLWQGETQVNVLENWKTKCSPKTCWHIYSLVFKTFLSRNNICARLTHILGLSSTASPPEIKSEQDFFTFLEVCGLWMVGIAVTAPLFFSTVSNWNWTAYSWLNH